MQIDSQHPGLYLRSVIEEHKLTVTRVAKHLDVSRVALSNLVNCSAGCSIEMALKFEQAFGISAWDLLQRQMRYDLAKAQEHGPFAITPFYS